MVVTAALIAISSGLGYLLPAIIGLESMGVPSPGETALVLASVLASQHQLNIVLVILIAAASAILGDNIGYMLGRHFGRDVLEAKGPFRERRVRIVRIGDRYFSEHGAKTVFIGRWIALIRFAVAWLAGINEMPLRFFFFWNALGAITWATTYGLVGYFGGKAIADVLGEVGIGAAIALGAIFVVMAVRLNRRERQLERQSGEDPDSGPVGPLSGGGVPQDGSNPSAAELMQ